MWYSVICRDKNKEGKVVRLSIIIGWNVVNGGTSYKGWFRVYWFFIFKFVVEYYCCDDMELIYRDSFFFVLFWLDFWFKGIFY